MRQLSTRPSPAHDTANFRTLASKIPSADIAAKLGQSLQAPAVTAHNPKSPLKVKPEDSRGICSNPDPGPSGFDWPTERAAKRRVPAPRRTRGSAALVGSKQRPRINFGAAAAFKKRPSIGNERARMSLFPYLVIDGTLDAYIPGVPSEARQPAPSLRDTYCSANAGYYCHPIRRSDHRNSPAARVSLRLTCDADRTPR